MTDDREARKAAYIANNPHAREIYLDGREAGYKAGYAQGWADSNAQAESHAEHAARLFYTMEAGEEVHRKFAKSAHDAIDVVAARNKMKPKGCK